MKTCSGCQLSLDYKHFCKKKDSPDGYSYFCRICSAQQAKEYYNDPKNKQRIIDNNKDRLLKTKRFVYEYLTSHPCVDCGETRPECLDFDHLRDKDMAISLMLRNARSIKSIQKEIEKCEIRCANCHRIKTAKEQNWYAFMVSPAGLEPA